MVCKIQILKQKSCTTRCVVTLSSYSFLYLRSLANFFADLSFRINTDSPFLKSNENGEYIRDCSQEWVYCTVITQ